MKKIKTLGLFIALSQCVMGQTFYNLGTVQDIRIVFAQSNWDQLMDAEKAGSGNYLMATSVTINGVLLDSVGVKYKGNSTYRATQVKNPLHIELDTYKNQDYQGYTDIKLSNVANDPSFLREVLSYQILRQYMVAPEANYANVYINGNLIGLYSSAESISKKFVDKNFKSKDKAFFKCNPIGGAGPGTSALPNLVYKGTDSTQYYSAYELNSDYGWRDLINLTDTLSNFTANIEKILDVDRALWMLAFNNVLVNLDSYSGAFAQNYYLYRMDNGQFTPIVWDLNESFGRFSSTGTSNLSNTTSKQQMTHLLHQSDVTYPLINKLLSIPMYKRMYLAHCKTMVQENFSNGSFLTTGQTLQNTISSSVQADQNKFYTFANFTTNLNNDITTGGGPGGGTTPGIGNLMNGRATYLMGLSDFSAIEPALTNVTPSNNAPLLNTTVHINATCTNSNAVMLGYRYDPELPFTRVIMYDDGLHNDGAANDNVYGNSIIMTNTFVQYYIYAENGTIGKFSPARAEYEFHLLNVVAPVPGDLVINEFQASNSTTVRDQDGEFDDWIELYNNSTQTIDLSNYYLSDNTSNLLKWKFPNGTSINGKGFLIVWADQDTTQLGLHSNFKLSAGGETLYLIDNTFSIIDQITFSQQYTDSTYGRYPNGTGSFQTLAPTFNSINSLTIGLASPLANEFGIKVYPNPSQGVINVEVLENNSTQHTVKIYNMTGQEVFISNIHKYKSIETNQWPSGLYILKVDHICKIIDIK